MGKKAKSTVVTADAPANKRQKAEKEQIILAPESGDDTTKQQLITLKQQFNSLHELRFTEPEKQLDVLHAKTEEMRIAHAQHIAALEQAHAAALLSMQVAHDLELKSALEDAAKQQQQQPSETKAIAILDCFKTLTGMHVNVDEEDEEVRGTCTIFNTRTKRGVKFKLEFAGKDKIKLSPGANCKQLLTKDLVGPHFLDKTEVPWFICRVQTHLFNTH